MISSFQGCQKSFGENSLFYYFTQSFYCYSRTYLGILAQISGYLNWKQINVHDILNKSTSLLDFSEKKTLFVKNLYAKDFQSKIYVEINGSDIQIY